MAKKSFKSNIVVFVCICIFYFLLTVPKIDFIFPDGRSALRISGFVPIVAGLLYGPLGALACGVGNLMSDALGNLQFSDFLGSFGVFMMAFMPYRLWHRVFLIEKNKPVFLDSVGSIIKFIFITIISIFSASAMGGIGGQLTQEYSFFGFFPQVALQYFDLSVVVGMLLFHVLSQYGKIRPQIPKDAYRNESHSSRFIPDYILCGLIIGLCLLLLQMTRSSGSRGSFEIHVLCVLLFICVVTLAFLPSSRRGNPIETREEFQPVGSIQGQLVTRFLLFLCIVLLCYGASMVVISHVYFVNTSSTELWTRILFEIALACVLLLSMLSVLLKWIEVYLANPIKTASSFAGRFVKQGALSKQDLSLPKANNEIDVLGASLAQMTTSIRQYVKELKEKTAAEERLSFEMSTARDIQMSLLQKNWSLAEPFDLAAKSQPAQEVGGDFYDFLRFSEEKIFVVIADVSGKGISAALFMMRANTVLSSRTYGTLSEAMTNMNNQLSEQNEAMMFVTVFAGILDCKAMCFRYVNAGHNPAIVYQNGELSVLDTTPDFAVGPVEDVQYTEHSIPISRDFRLLLYTDGVTEAENTAGEFFGMERLLQAAHSTLASDKSGQDVIDSIEREVLHFAQGAKQADDITMLCLSFPKENTEM